MFSIKLDLKRNRQFINGVYRILFWLESFGVGLLKTISAIRGVPLVLKDYFTLVQQNNQSEAKWKLGLTMPCFHDRFDFGGVAKGDYFHQDLLVAQRIFARKPTTHVDVGSRIDGFVAHVAAFRAIEVFDIRPIISQPVNITFKQANLMALPEGLCDYCDSLSCLHALEHFGLGRYGDPVDIDGYSKGFESLSKMLKSGGILYLSLPIGRERIEFNAHRVFSISTILNLSTKNFKLVKFSYVDDQGDLHAEVNLTEKNISDSFRLNYGCGIFELQKIS
jgi:Caenorhabditis protein of unknown function, DUF268